MSFKELVRQFFDGEITVLPDSWHYRLYNWYFSKNPYKRQVTRENLCHYMRVLLIWAPLEWFFKEPIVGFIRPWLIAGVVATLAGTTIGLVLWHEAMVGLLLVAVPIITILGMLRAVTYIYDKKGATTGRKCLALAHLVLVATGTIVSGYQNVALAYVVGVIAAIALLAFYAVVFTILMVVLGAFVSVQTAWETVGNMLQERRDQKLFREHRWYDSIETEAEKPPSPVVTSLRLAGAYVMAQKRKICPFIRLPEEQHAA